MSASDLSLRFRQPWFEAGGFLVLRLADRMVGFCWTKVHRNPWGDIGEIYVIGVDPEHAGRGLGRLAVTAGLDHLARLGLSEAMLYVEAANEPAIGLYRSLGLTETWRDRRWTTGSEAGDAPTPRRGVGTRTPRTPTARQRRKRHSRAPVSPPATWRSPPRFRAKKSAQLQLRFVRGVSRGVLCARCSPACALPQRRQGDEGGAPRRALCLAGATSRHR